MWSFQAINPSTFVTGSSVYVLYESGELSVLNGPATVGIPWGQGTTVVDASQHVASFAPLDQLSAKSVY